MKRKSSGFTIIELLIVIAIVGVAAAIGLPSFSPMIAKVRLDSELSTLSSGLNFARSEAQKRGLQVSVCPSSNGTSCTGGTSWTSGWIVLLDSTSQVLQAYGASRDTLTSVPAGTALYPQFTSMGYVFFNGKLVFQDSNNTSTPKRCLSFNAGNWTSYTGASCS